MRFTCLFCLFSVVLSLGCLEAKSPPRVALNPIYDQKLLHFGFTIGVNQMGFTVKPAANMANLSDTLYGISMKPQMGFTVGIVTNLRLGKYFDLRFVPTLSLGERYLVYTLKTDGKQIYSESKKIEATYVEFPLEIKWKAARLVNSRPYVVAGIRYSVDLASLAKKKAEHPDDYFVKLKRNDVGLTLGVGWDFFLPMDNKIAIELKMFYGLNDLLVRENLYYTNYIDKVGAKMLQLCVTFE
ncbi:MAG: porin family protein [Bacteroidales bacterium]